MNKNKINKRITYTYLDYKKGLLTSYIDIDMWQDDEYMTEKELQVYVKRKWHKFKYTGGELESVTFDSIS